MNMKKGFALVLCLALLAAFAACGQSGQPSSSQPAGTSAPASTPVSAAEPTVLKFGVLAPLTGNNREYGIQFEVGMSMALDEINAMGGTSNGYIFELDVQDSKGEPKDSADLARQFADNDEIMGILGDFTSGCCMAVAPIVDEAGMILFSPTASNPDFAPMSPYCFSIQGRQDAEGPYNAEFVIQGYMGKSKPAIIYINSDWGISAYENFIKRADEIGLDVCETVNFVQDEKDFSSLITRLRAAEPDVVIIMDQGAVPQIVNQIRQTGWDIDIMAQGPSTNEQVIELAGENAEGLITTSPFIWDYDDPRHVEWVDEFRERAGFTPTIHGACAYDTIYMLKGAIEAFGDAEVTRDGIRENLQNLKGYVGFTGPLEFEEFGDVTREFLTCQVIDGKWVKVQGFASEL